MSGRPRIFDTDQLAPRQRPDAVHEVYHEAPRRAVVIDQHPVRLRSVHVDLGPETQMLQAGGTALQIVRTARHVRQDAPEFVAIGFHRRGETTVTAGGVHAELRDGHLNCVDLTRPYRLAHRTGHVHEVLIVSNRRAGVSVDTVRAAAPVLDRSPLYDLVRGHVANLFGAVSELSSRPRLLTSTATIALVRALLTTAGEAADRNDAMDEALEARVVLHIDNHLSDPELSAERIAATHNISLRHLYNVWKRTGHQQTLQQWIIERRLERAREQLAGLDPKWHTIASVARTNGFANTSHFSRRFRAAFGATPSEWRADAGMPR